MSKMKRFASFLLTLVMLITMFTSTGMYANASLLPLPEEKAYLVLYDKTESEISSMEVNEMLDMLVDSDGVSIPIDSTATTVWRYFKSADDGLEEYKEYHIDTDGIITDDERIDLSIESELNNYTLELIIGDGNQLSSGNKRYIVKVYISDDIEDIFEFQLYTQDVNGNRTEIVPESTTVSEATNALGWNEINTRFKVPEHTEGTEYYLGATSTVAELPYMDVKVYDFTEYFLGGEDLSSQLLFQNMKEKDAGYKSTSFDSLGGGFVFEYTDTRTGEVTTKAVEFQIYNKDGLNAHMCLYSDNKMISNAILVGNNVNFNWDNLFPDEQTFVKTSRNKLFMLNDGLSVDDEYYFYLDIYDSAYGTELDNFNSHVTKAVVGAYNSIEETEGLDDIKEYLTPTDKSVAPYGYKTNYNHTQEGGGVTFTLFYDDNTKLTLTVGVIEYNPLLDPAYFREFTEKPIIGEADPWFRVKGASDDSGNEYDTYVVENGKNINMDTYYGYGYQTIFINDANADLSSIKPDFWYANTDRVYAVSKDSGNRVDENHIRDFNEENQQYTGVIIDKDGKENERNYWVTFKKLNSNGPELYVYGPSEREVILDEYFEFKHDILIANIGNAPLENVSVELLDAKNVKLDSYWTVGGDGNNTLSSFTTTSTNTEYGELANMAKIRLLPDGDGQVEGTLIIRAKGQEPVMITLNGTAQNPEIVTETLSDAVKYVPYQQIVATDNMHDWVETKFSIVDGTLPEGITLNSETGEIYGVPTVPDGNSETTYSFKVEAKYLVEGEDGYFDSSYKDFKLVVKPNTDENVYLASDSDDGYSIKQPIGIQTGEYSFELNEIVDTEFISNGEYGEFVGLWLNGVKLEKGVDYNSESGSTKITVKKQTFENKAKPNDSNTIAIEFRKDTNGDGKGDDGAEMNRTAQNFNLKVETSVDKVIKKIAALPSNITLKDKSNVQSARSAYNALSAADKEKVTNRQKLFDAEAKIAKLEADKAAADNVIAKINAIPSIINSNAKDEIAAARTAYNALTAEQKKLVTNYSRLVAAEKALVEYEKDKAEADKVVALINAIPSSVTLKDKETVNKARAAYNMLTAAQKGYVTNYSKLTGAEEKIVKLEAEAQEQAKVNSVIAAINAIPNPVTLKDKQIVEAARAGYNALTAAQKAKVVNYNDLMSAEATIAALEAQENADEQDKAAAQKVINLIGELPKEITLADKTIVESARKEYNALTDKQKKLVTNYNDLIDAEAAIKAWEDYEEASKKDQEAANKVINLINVIPDNVTLEDKVAVEKARKAYDALTDKQKKIVTNYNILVAAEVKIAELENEDYEAVQSVTFVGILIGKDGKSLTDRIIEIHSTTQTGRTDENGSFQFNDVAFGKHTILIKDADGHVIAKGEFNIVMGSPLALNKNEIVAENGSVFTVRMQLDGSKLTFLNVEEGNKAPVIDTNDKEHSGIEIDDAIPETGDNSNLTVWYALPFVSVTTLVVITYGGIRKKRYSVKHNKS